MIKKITFSGQWRRQLWGTGARAPLDAQQFHF